MRSVSFPTRPNHAYDFIAPIKAYLFQAFMLILKLTSFGFESSDIRFSVPWLLGHKSHNEFSSGTGESYMDNVGLRQLCQWNCSR